MRRDPSDIIKVIDVPHAAGAYRPEASTDSGLGKQIEWGMHIGKGWQEDGGRNIARSNLPAHMFLPK